MLRKRTNGVAGRPRATTVLHDAVETAGATPMDRRGFLRASGLAVGGISALAAAGGTVTKATAATAASGAVELVKSVCTHCSVGCTVVAEVQGGVWVGQEPGWDSPFNLGAHCAKGAAVREHAHGERRLRYPMKLEGGEWKRMSWDDAINEIGDGMLKIRQESGPDSVYWLGSAKHNNEQAYLFRKFAAYWGTNSYNDIHNSRAIFIIGGN
ncbi:MAG: molybdopterin-dependent oxidoreductase, partial [Pseudomonadota bacterium]